MKRLIIITGQLAAGKSTLADSLSKELGVLAIKKDTIKERLCDLFGFSNREENLKLSYAAVDQMFHILQRSVEAKQDLILEANFRSEQIEQIQRIIKDKDYKVILIMLVGDKKILFERFNQRIPTRHKAHLSMHLNEDYDSFCKYQDDLIKGNFIFPKLEIDITDKTIDEVKNIVLENL